MIKFLNLVEKLQLASEKKSQPHRSEEEILKDYEVRSQFYSALANKNISDGDLALQAALPGNKDLFGDPNENSINVLRKDLKRFPLNFTNAEPPSVAVLLARAFARVSRFSQAEMPHAEFILATDLTYRPHASVSEWERDRYLILMGRYLLVDLCRLAHMIAIYVREIRKPDDEAPWLNEDFPHTLLTGLKRSENQWQFPYTLCSAAEGERYRFATMYTEDLFEDRVANEISTGAIDFLVGHEIMHVLANHLREPPKRNKDIPYFFNPTSDLLSTFFANDSEKRTASYLDDYWPHHQREIMADMAGLEWAAGNGSTGAWDLRLMGAQLAISTISFIDRVRFLIKHKIDPVIYLGSDKYAHPGLVDIVFPQPSHPWGKTRETLLGASLSPIYGHLFSEQEILRKTLLMKLVRDIFHRYNAHALAAIHFVNSKEGEFVALMPPGQDKLHTCYFPWSTIAEGKHEKIVTDASQFYMDLSGVKLINFRGDSYS